MYGLLEPIDIKAMEGVFQKLLNDKNVPVNGSHWGSLISVYGSVLKDLPKAIETFERCASHPSSLKSEHPMPDAVVYEALLGVFVSLHRMDLAPEYLDKLAKSGAHWTAYISNTLIKGYAAAGDIQKARQTFEMMHDPPFGIAATNNHAPHSPTEPHARADEPIFREVRGALGLG